MYTPCNFGYVRIISWKQIGEDRSQNILMVTDTLKRVYIYIYIYVYKGKEIFIRPNKWANKKADTVQYIILIMAITTNPLVVGRVIGDVLEPFASSIPLRVVYNNNKEVINSGELKPSQIINPPRVEVGGDDLRTLYTLVYIYVFI